MSMESLGMLQIGSANQMEQQVVRRVEFESGRFFRGSVAVSHAVNTYRQRIADGQPAYPCRRRVSAERIRRQRIRKRSVD